MQQHQAGSVRLVGRRGAIQITRRARGEVLVSLEGDRVDELLPRAAAELAHDLGRLQHLVVDATGADEAAHLACSRWADAHRDRAVRVTFLASAVDADAPVSESVSLFSGGAPPYAGGASPPSGSAVGPVGSSWIGPGPVPTRTASTLHELVQLRHA